MTFVLILSFLKFAKGVNESESAVRVVGGQNVTKREDFPYQASIRFNSRHHCGGSIITSQHILSAAHCCFYRNKKPINPRHLKVVVGDLNINRSNAHTVVKDVVAIKYHENYSSPPTGNDIAVLKLEKQFTEWNPFIRNIELAKSLPKPGKQCVVSGWGQIKEGGPSPAILQMVRLPIILQSKCIEIYPKRMQEGMFCAGYTEGGMDSCHGDSGGPLICDGILYGIVSWGKGCARPGYPTVYVDVGYYRDWIINETGLKASTVSLHNKKISCVLFFYIVNYYILL